MFVWLFTYENKMYIFTSLLKNEVELSVFGFDGKQISYFG